MNGEAQRMDRPERILYHQIHPLKLLTDIATAIAATALFWNHRAALAFTVGFVPSIAVTAILLRWAGLEPYRNSAFGQYVGRYMTRGVEVARLAGLVPMWGGAWVRQPAIIAAGVVWILGCWLWGLRPHGGIG
jgi:hypothetical protein